MLAFPTQEAEAGGSGAQGHPWLLRELEPSLGYARPCLKQHQSKTKLEPGQLCWCTHLIQLSEGEAGDFKASLV